MLQELSSRFIEMAEEAIQSKIALNTYPHISVGFYEEVIKCWNEINNSEDNKKNYAYFASNALGFISYGFYKDVNGRIYIIEAYLNSEIYSIYHPLNFINHIKKFLDDYAISNNMP